MVEFYELVEARLGVWRTGLAVEDLVGSRGGVGWPAMVMATV